MMYIRRLLLTSLYISAIAMFYSISARASLHKFLKSIAEIIPQGHEYCFTVRGNNAMSLSNLTMLTDTHFAFGLLISGVANVKRKGEGGWQVTSSKNKWEKLLRGVEVEDNILQDGLDLAEVSKSGVRTSKFVKVSEGSGKQGKKSHLLTVRLGQRVKGEAVVASKQFLHDVQPPANRGMRQQQRDLSNEIATMYKETYIEIEEDAGKLNELEEQTSCLMTRTINTGEDSLESWY